MRPRRQEKRGAWSPSPFPNASAPQSHAAAAAHAAPADDGGAFITWRAACEHASGQGVCAGTRSSHESHRPAKHLASICCVDGNGGERRGVARAAASRREADASTAHASKKAKTAAASAPPLGALALGRATHAMRKAWRQVCLLEVVSVEWRYLAPWSRMSQKQSSGSGFCISGRRILTNAHVVKSATDIRVRQHGSAQRLRAHVVAYGPDVDLAILELDGEDAAATDAFFSDAELSLADGLPALQEVVRAIGFPTGGKTICVTEGVVSRIDTIAGTPPAALLAIQIDAASSPGNAGGPETGFDAHAPRRDHAEYERAAAVSLSLSRARTLSSPAARTRGLTDNIGYVIPAEVARAFLERCDAAAPSRAPRRGDVVLAVGAVPLPQARGKSLRAARRRARPRQRHPAHERRARRVRRARRGRRAHAHRRPPHRRRRPGARSRASARARARGARARAMSGRVPAPRAKFHGLARLSA